MKEISKPRADKMGRLNNRLVELIDKSDLQPPDVVLVLKHLAARIEQAFLISLNSGDEKNGS